MIVTCSEPLAWDSERGSEKRLPHLRKAACAQIAQSEPWEVVRGNINRVLNGLSDWNENNGSSFSSVQQKVCVVSAVA